MNQVIASQYSAAQGIFLPVGFRGQHRDALISMGVRFDGEVTDYGFQHAFLPEGWSPVPAAESSMQLRLEDNLGRVRARVFYKPGSEGGGADFMAESRFTINLKIEDGLQWGEVYDGKKLVHRTATGPTEQYASLTWQRQPEYLAAKAWLDERQPEHANPSAYWH